MQSLLSQEDVFNQGYFEVQRATKSKGAKVTNDFNSLLNYACKNGYLSEENLEKIISGYKESITKYVLSDLVYDDEDDINLLVEEKITYCYASINDYLMSMKNPYNAVKCIFDTDPNKLIIVAMEQYKNHQVATQNKLIEVEKKSKLLFDYIQDFRLFIKYLKDKIVDINAPYLGYRLMDGKDFALIDCLDDLDARIENLSIEIDILNRFQQSEILRLLLSFTNVDVDVNVTETALFNYVYNSFYKGGSSIDFTSNMSKIVTKDIRMGVFDVEDVIEIITTGEVKFSELEEKYILEYFVNIFKREVIQYRHIDCFKKTK